MKLFLVSFKFTVAARYLVAVLVWMILCCSVVTVAQIPAPAPVEDTPVASKEIAVANVADDQAIEERLTRILERSEWFTEVAVDVKEGIVILGGSTPDGAYKRWAEQVAGQTVDVVAVVNRIEIISDGEWDFSPAVDASVELWHRSIAALPLLALSFIILCITWFFARTAKNILASLLANRVESVMLRNIVARILTLPVMVIGLYLVLRVTGLGQLAATILGGTGILGLVLGIAFRDISENFLASILISVQRPFRLGDHIRVMEFEGFVQAVTTRGTVLMNLQGNHVQIPNATIYKQPIVNFTANPNMALNFKVGIGYDCSVAFAQSVAMEVLREHPAVLETPEPLVLTDSLDASTITLNIIFWVDGTRHSVLKVRSAVMRMIKSAYITKGVSMPDDAREVIFPQGIRVVHDGQQVAAGAPVGAEEVTSPDGDSVSVSEGDLVSEAGEIHRQAIASVYGENEKNIL